MDQEEKKQCKVELVPDDVLGWVFKPDPDCKEILAKISEKQGPHAQRYLNVRKREQVEPIQKDNSPT